MSKLIFTLSVILCAMHFNAQTDMYFKLKKLAEQTRPDLHLDNKLLAVNFWSVDDPESREANKGLEKAYVAYQTAKLKGGLKGLVVITVCKDGLSSTADITLGKDGIVKSISLSAEDLKNEVDISSVRNVVFDSDGNEVYRDKPSSGVFDAIHKLITR